jgi:prophage regulatory protein
MSAPDLRFLDLKEVIHRTSLSRATIYRKLEEKNFPKPIAIPGTRRIVWIESEVAEWLTKQIATARNAPNRENMNGERV